MPYDILGIFILFVLDQNKKIIYILDPLPRPTWGLLVFRNMENSNKLNLALRLANPEWKDDISKWERKVPVVPTNSHRYEVSLNYNLNLFIMQHSMLHFIWMQCYVWLWGFLLNAYMAWWIVICSNAHGEFSQPYSFATLWTWTLYNILYNVYVGWFWVEKAICGTSSEVSRQWSDKQYSYLRTRHNWSHKEMDLLK